VQAGRLNAGALAIVCQEMTKALHKVSNPAPQEKRGTFRFGKARLLRSCNVFGSDIVPDFVQWSQEEVLLLDRDQFGSANCSFIVASTNPSARTVSMTFGGPVCSGTHSTSLSVPAPSTARDVGQRLSAVVPDDEAGAGLLYGPGCGEAVRLSPIDRCMRALLEGRFYRLPQNGHTG
jgi:hypothetical protein